MLAELITKLSTLESKARDEGFMDKPQETHRKMVVSWGFMVVLVGLIRKSLENGFMVTYGLTILYA